MHNSNSKLSQQNPVLLFATPPPLDQLKALTIYITDASSCSHGASKFQPQVIKCREFIFTEPEVIGSPAADIRDRCFHLVAKIDLLKTGRLQARLTRVGLQVTQPHNVSPELYQSCLRYTLTARLSPTWNKAGPWLIQGRDFLTSKGCTNAVKLNLIVNHNELYFSLEATALKLAPLQVTDLDILGAKLQQFLANTDAQIDHENIASDWCYVLPSMKRGRIMSISHELPEDSPFVTYRDLKRHWKNTYGYRLPEDEDGVVYYQVHFGPLGGRLFTYPEICLRSREMQPVARVDPKPILRSFIQEIQAKFPTICGHPLKLQSKAKFTVTDLLEAGQTTRQTQANLTGKMSGTRPSLYRSKTEMDSLLYHNHIKLQPVSGQKQAILNSTIPPKPSVEKSRNTPSSVIQNIDYGKANNPPNTRAPLVVEKHSQTKHVPVSNKPADNQLASDTPSKSNISASQIPVARKLFPKFLAKQTLAPQFQQSRESMDVPKLVPVFKKQAAKSAAQFSTGTTRKGVGETKQKAATKSNSNKVSALTKRDKLKEGKTEAKRRKLQKAED